MFMLLTLLAASTGVALVSGFLHTNIFWYSDLLWTDFLLGANPALYFITYSKCYKQNIQIITSDRNGM